MSRLHFLLFAFFVFTGVSPAFSEMSKQNFQKAFRSAVSDMAAKSVYGNCQSEVGNNLSGLNVYCSCAIENSSEKTDFAFIVGWKECVEDAMRKPGWDLRIILLD